MSVNPPQVTSAFIPPPAAAPSPGTARTADAVPPPDHNPEALEDIERGTFKDVDANSSSMPPPVPPPPPSIVIAKPAGGLGFLSSMNVKDQIALLAFFSLVVMIQSSVNCSNNYYSCTEVNGFAVAAGTISLFFCIVALFIEHRSLQASESHRLVFGVFMFLWWAAAMIALTFFGPFVNTVYANGFFGTWGGFIIATLLLSNTSERFRRSMNTLASGMSQKPVMYLLISSIIEVGSSIQTCIPQSVCNGLNAFAIALGTVSGILCLILIPLVSRLNSVQHWRIAVFFCVWWVVGGMIVTFVRPFQALGNGYFSVFAAIVSSFVLLQSEDNSQTTV